MRCWWCGGVPYGRGGGVGVRCGVWRCVPYGRGVVWVWGVCLTAEVWCGCGVWRCGVGVEVWCGVCALRQRCGVEWCEVVEVLGGGGVEWCWVVRLLP